MKLTCCDRQIGASVFTHPDGDQTIGYTCDVCHASVRARKSSLDAAVDLTRKSGIQPTVALVSQMLGDERMRRVLGAKGMR